MYRLCCLLPTSYTDWIPSKFHDLYLYLYLYMYLYREALTMPPYTVNYTYVHQVRLYCHNTDYVHVNGHHRTIFGILAK
jgi:hypothetical protein